VRWVADASVVVAYLLNNATETERRGILEDAHAPTLLDVEVTQTLRGLLRGAKLDLATAELGREDLALLRVRRHPDAALLQRAWELRDRCSTYDALYVALAEALDATLLTRDARLVRAAAGLVEFEARE
jgi:predicted nucleic acid-binding protein